MKTLAAFLGRATLTFAIVAIAAVVGARLWNYYMDEPWTRDGHVLADVIGVTPDVSGLIGDVLVSDNQVVKKGDVLLRVDPQRFVLALKLADAAVAGQKATLDQAQRDFQRYQTLGREVATQQKIEQAQEAQDVAAAAYQQALANQAIARLNLERSEIHAPANGVITNMSLKPGDYVTAGKAVMALVDSDSLHVEGYFEETKLARIRVGDSVAVQLMGQKTPVVGHVESIAGGIQDRERSDGSQLLADVNPTFSWVRLPQRVPVRIALDKVPPEVRLVAGLTATVVVEGHPLAKAID